MKCLLRYNYLLRYHCLSWSWLSVSYSCLKILLITNCYWSDGRTIHKKSNSSDTGGKANNAELSKIIRKQYPLKKNIHLILDGAGYYRSKDLKDEADKLNIKLYYLPPYSPNLNPIERLWKVMNEHVRNNQYFSSAREFREQIDNFFQNTLPQIGNSLKGRINDNFQVLNPASWGGMGIYWHLIST